MRTTNFKRKAFEEEEEELLAFARSYLSEAFPNPQRTGCPPDDALRLWAIRPLEGDEAVNEHLMFCSPCFNAYMAHLAIQLRRIRRNAWIRRSAITVGVAAILVIAGYVLTTRRRAAPIIVPRTPAPITTPGSPIQTPATAMYVPVVIDLSDASPTRGSNQDIARSVRQIIPSASPLALSLRLPLASEERVYLITLRSGQHVVWSMSAQAFREDGDTLLRVRADLRDLTPGRYNLQVASERTHLTVPVLVKGAVSESRQQR